MSEVRDKAVNQILKEACVDAINKAEKAAYIYASACEIGKERECAFEVYENVRTALRVKM